MTTIAWDGERLAADRQLTWGSLRREVDKISRFGDRLIGAAGRLDLCEAMKRWYIDGADPEKFPKLQETAGNWAELLVIQPDRSINVYQRTPYPWSLPPQQVAIGSGRDYAMAAMHCGKTALQAVMVAAHFDPDTGDTAQMIFLVDPAI